jgi:hypothetical protein
VLPLDRGDIFNWGRRSSPLAGPDLDRAPGLVSWMIWFCNWLLSFEWVSVIAAPFGALADVVQGSSARSTGSRSR